MRFTKHLAAASFVVSLTTATSAFAAPPLTTATLVIDGIGSSPVLAWSWGASNSSTTHLGGGGGAGNPNFQDVSITRYTDSLSSMLVLKTATGGPPFDKVTLQDDSTILELYDVIVTSVSVGNRAGDKKAPPQDENVSLNFPKFCYSTGGAKTCWDIVNKGPWTP
jgi:type VI secretion system secreted protein Hcp